MRSGSCSRPCFSRLSDGRMADLKSSLGNPEVRRIDNGGELTTIPLCTVIVRGPLRCSAAF
jgi:hypothetical protein